MEHVLFARWDVRCAVASSLAQFDPQKRLPVHWTALLSRWVSPQTLLENRFYRQLQFVCPLKIGTTNAEVPSKSRRCRSTSFHILCNVITLCPETKIWMEHFEQFPRCNQANFGKRTCVISVPSCEASPERTHPEASPLHFTSPKYQGAQMLPHFVYVQSQRPRSELNTLNSFHDVIRLTLGSALVWYRCHHVKPVQSGLILKRRRYTSRRRNTREHKCFHILSMSRVRDQDLNWTLWTVSMM